MEFSFVYFEILYFLYEIDYGGGDGSMSKRGEGVRLIGGVIRMRLNGLGVCGLRG